MSNEKSSVKKRNWAFVVYPDSAPSDWIERLQQTGLPFAVSPLHNKDLNADGTHKKSHYHVIVIYSGPTSFNVVNALCDSLNQPIPKALESVKGYYRYFTHADNPEKAQYSDSDIRCCNGFNPLDFIEMTRSEVLQIMKSLQSLIRDNGIKEYSDFMDILLDNDMISEYDVASSHTMFFQHYITSKRNKLCNVQKDGESDA